MFPPRICVTQEDMARSLSLAEIQVASGGDVDAGVALTVIIIFEGMSLVHVGQLEI